ncbi:MAG: cytidyltransferase [Rickettsiales bacterium TMED289]|nr:MAG: cytidyltransferase [Rickettsiales bacterium TMED289]|tara:strand:- start:51 stop:443 length:393 start_codon:yes stop_codon:yes gene_type:complete
MFDPKKPTVMLLGRWQPWHDGHLALFRRAHAKTGQVAIHVRDVKDSSGGEGQEDNPFSFEEISKDISEKLLLEGYKVNEDFIIQLVPNIINITYGRGVGYKIEKESFDSDIESISATKIRKSLRDDGKIK